MSSAAIAMGLDALMAAPALLVRQLMMGRGMEGMNNGRER